MPPCSLSPSSSCHSAASPHFTSLPFAAGIPVKTCCLSHTSPHSTPYGLYLLYSILACVLDGISIFLWDHLSIFSPFVCFLFMFELCWELPWSSMQAFCQLHLLFYTLGWTILELGESKTLKHPELLCSTRFYAILISRTLNNPKPTLLKPRAQRLLSA